MMNRQIDFTTIYQDDQTAKFEAFHKEHPHVLQTIVSKARQLKARGHRVAGMAMIFEAMRWDWMLRTADEPFKLNNNHKAHYTRLVDANYEDLRGFFTRRMSVADE